MFSVKKKKLFLAIICVYSLVFLTIVLFWVLNRMNIPTEDEEFIINFGHSNYDGQNKIQVEIWGKASISLYLWKHILNGKITSLHNGFMKVGNLTIDDFEFSFKNGPGFIQTTVPQSVQYLVLVLNGRTDSNVVKAQEWLDYLKKLGHLKRVCLVILGNEECRNDWILPYMASRGGNINAAFIIYDSPLVDNEEIFQWPLGVAEYRGFPDLSDKSIGLLNKRPYLANFVGTVYKNSSREVLVDLIKKEKLKNKINLIERYEWIPNETKKSRQQYVEAILSSDLTLSPVGMNTECYRIYEAMALGSMPVVENVVTKGICDQSPSAPLRLLKQYKAPVLWVSNWTELTDILHKETTLTFKQLADRRIVIRNWYKRFKQNMKSKFLNVLENKFVN